MHVRVRQVLLRATPDTLTRLTRDVWLLYLTRFLRLFAYGLLSVVLVFYLVGLGLSEVQTGMLLTLTLAGDTVVSLYLTTHADRIGRRRMLVVGALLMTAAGLAFASTSSLLWLLVAGIVGVVSPSGGEVGPFLPIEQAALTHVVPGAIRTDVFAWYTLAGAVGTATGALVGGVATEALQRHQVAALSSYRTIVVAYAALGIVLAGLFTRLSRASEATAGGGNEPRADTMIRLFGLGASRRVVAKLSALFALDAFGGGFVIQSFAAYWFYLRYGVEPGTLGAIFFWANIFGGLSALVASRLAARFGLVNTMVATHLPSNVLLILVPLMPNLPLAITLLLVRFSISQMDVPTRQSYLMAVVSPEERSAAGGVAGVARTIGASISPVLAGLLFARPSLVNAPFFVAGALKIVYDLALYREFVSVRPPEEVRSVRDGNADRRT
jgi:MFS family permease